jgi:L-amino acid N-acyltransferase YncA
MATTETRPQLVMRPAREDDAAGLREVFNEGVQDGLATFDTESRTLEAQRRLIAAAEQDPKHPILVAELRDWALGWITVQPYGSRPQLEDVGEVIVFVRRSFRNYGVGRQLMKTIQKEARNLGYRKLVGHVLADSHDSLRLCRATGWREVGRHEQHARHGEALRDVVVVEYLVPPAASVEPAPPAS